MMTNRKLDLKYHLNWHFFSKDPIKEREDVYVEFGKKDLIYFDPVCKNFFK